MGKNTFCRYPPDPTLIYFNNAQISIKPINKYRDSLLEKLDFGADNPHYAKNEMFNFFGFTSGYVISLFTALESFINSLIPDDFVFKIVGGVKTELYNKSQIMEYIKFDKKMKEILQLVTGIVQPKSSPTLQLIYNLKNYRDEIVHTKPGDSPFKYESLLRTALNFKYEETLEAVAKFINGYKPEYIVECQCGADL